MDTDGVKALNGRAVILILVGIPPASDTSYVLTATLDVADSLVSFRFDSEEPVMIFPRQDVQAGLFPSSTLQNLVTDEYIRLARELSRNAESCVVLATATRPRSARPLPQLFGGIALGARNKVLLMQVR